MIAKWCVAKILQQQRQRYDDTAVMKPEQFENSRMQRNNKLLHLVRRFEIRPYRHDNPKSTPYVYPTPTGLTLFQKFTSACHSSPSPTVTDRLPTQIR